MERLSHLDEAGRARMVDVGAKPVTERRAVARAVLRTSVDTAGRLAHGRLPKGDALPVARVAGIMAAKRTSDLIPLCHPVALAGVELEVDVDVASGATTLVATVRAADRTGVEMEALVAVSIAALALYDMVKAVERGAVVERVELLEKTGGARGDWEPTSPEAASEGGDQDREPTSPEAASEGGDQDREPTSPEAASEGGDQDRVGD